VLIGVTAASLANAYQQADRAETEGRAGVNNIVMVHGASEGGWCFDRFRVPFEAKGWTVHTPDLLGHGRDATHAKTRLVGVGLADYCAQLEPLLKGFASPPVLLGHSMGAVLVQQLAAMGLARALVLVSPAPRTGILPSSDSEKELAQGFMTIPSFWKTVISPDFDIASALSMNKVPEAERHALFDRFGPESGLAYYELFFWTIDKTKAAFVDTAKVACPVLIVSGSDDKMVSPATARAAATGYSKAAVWDEAGHGHMLPMEPGAEKITGRILDWTEAQNPTP
jgi:pimeloyl-ACP methyl ester carboxylesterase